MKKIYDFGPTAKPGTNEYYRLWRAANRKSVRERAKKYYYADPQKQRDRTRKYRQTENGAKKAREKYQEHLASGAVAIWNLRNKLKKFGLTIDDFKRILEAQGGGCGICGTSEPGSKKWTRLFVDHCHVTNKVRGVLCHHCNATLGHMKDSPELLRSAIEYLRKN